jgi:IS5 family transposase
LRGTRGDVIFAVLCDCGHNLRKILIHIRKLLAFLIAMSAKTVPELLVIRVENRHPPQTAAI